MTVGDRRETAAVPGGLRGEFEERARLMTDGCSGFAGMHRCRNGGPICHGECLAAIWRDGFRYKKAGVMLLDLHPAATVQAGLLMWRPGKLRSSSA
jgi:hypothetical protein